MSRLIFESTTTYSKLDVAAGEKNLGFWCDGANKTEANLSLAKSQTHEINQNDATTSISSVPTKLEQQPQRRQSSPSAATIARSLLGVLIPSSTTSAPVYSGSGELL